MKTAHSLLILTLIFFAFASCESKEVIESEEIDEILEEVLETPLGDNSQVSLDWNGTYEGTIPCADCEGIQTSLTLNTDGTYLIKTQYLGRNDDLQEEVSGNFKWENNGSTIALANLKGMPGKYKVGENRIWHLDMNGDMITGDLADHYILTKK